MSSRQETKLAKSIRKRDEKTIKSSKKKSKKKSIGPVCSKKEKSNKKKSQKGYSNQTAKSKKSKNKKSQKTSTQKQTKALLGFDYRAGIGNEFGCGKRLTDSDFIPHTGNPLLRALYKFLFNSLTTTNFGFFTSQITSTQGVPCQFANILLFTIRNFRLNGRYALRARRFDPDNIKFFSSPSDLKKIKADVTPEISYSFWASSDREGLSRLRFDTNTIIGGIGQLFIQDANFYYGGCSFQGLSACEWNKLPSEFWPTEIDPDATLAEVFANPLIQMFLVAYDIDGRNLQGIPQLAAFGVLNVSLRDLLVMPYPATEVGLIGAWPCFLWMAIQQILTALLNSATPAMNYRFPLSFLLGAAGWMVLRWAATAYHGLNLPSGTSPIDWMTLFTNLEYITLLICSLNIENNRGCFSFPSCPSSVGSTSTPSEQAECCDDGLDQNVCDPMCVDRKARVNPFKPISPECVNQLENSDPGGNPCVCRRCVESKSSTASSGCTPSCTEEECCVDCPVATAPFCIPTVLNLALSFISLNYVVDDTLAPSLSSSGSTLQSSSTSSSNSSASASTSTSTSGSASGSESKQRSAETLLTSEKQLQQAISSAVSTATSHGAFQQTKLAQRENFGRLLLQVSESAENQNIDFWLVKEYYTLFDSIQALVLQFTLGFNPTFSGFMQSLTDSNNKILELTLESSNIPLNSSQTLLLPSPFYLLQEAIATKVQPSTFVSATTDPFGQRFDYTSLLFGLYRLSQNDMTAYYLNKRLEGLTPCEWNQAAEKWWPVPSTTLVGDVLSSAAAQIYLHPYGVDTFGFLGYPGLYNFSASPEASAMTLRQMLVATNPIPGGGWLDLVWFSAQQFLAAFLNASSPCLFYRFPLSYLFGAGSYALLTVAANMVNALNIGALPTPIIDEPTLAASTDRLLTLIISITRANLNGVWQPPPKGSGAGASGQGAQGKNSKKQKSKSKNCNKCKQPPTDCGCSATISATSIPGQIEVLQAFQVFMTDS